MTELCTNSNVGSHRISRLAEKIRDEKYRREFVASRVKYMISHQIRELRGDMSQKDFGAILGKPQSVVSRLQDPSYGKWSLQTLLEIADSLDIGLFVQFVDFPTLLELDDELSSGAASLPASYNEKAIDALIDDVENTVVLGEVIEP